MAVQEASLEDFIRCADQAGGGAIIGEPGNSTDDIHIDDDNDDDLDDDDLDDQDDLDDTDDQDDNHDDDDDNTDDDDHDDDNDGDDDDDLDDTDDDDDDDEPGFNEQALSGLYDQLLEEGVLAVPDDFKFDGTTASIDDALNHTFDALSKSAQQTLMESLPDEVATLVDYALQTGRGIDDFIEARGASTSLEDLDIEDEQIQQEVLRQYYKSTTKYNDDRIDRLVSRARKSGELAEDARDAYRDLLNLQEENKQNMQDQIAAIKAKQVEDEKKARDNFENIIKSSDSIDKVRKNRLRNFIVNKSRRRGEAHHSTELSRTLTLLTQNPEHIVQLGDLLLDYSPEKGINLERIQDKKSSKKTRDVLSRLDKALDPKTNTRGGTSSFDRKKRKAFDWNLWAEQANSGGGVTVR